MFRLKDNFIDFVDKVKKEYKIIFTYNERIASIDVKSKVIYVHKDLPEDVKMFVITHELGHAYLEMLYEKGHMVHRQPPRDQAYETLCDLLSAIYVYHKGYLTPKQILKAFKVLYGEREHYFRYIMLYNAMILTGRLKDGN